MAVAVLAVLIAAVFPFAQEGVTPPDTVVHVAPSAGVVLGAQPAVKAGILRAQIADEGAVDALRVRAEHLNGSKDIAEQVADELLAVRRGVLTDDGRIVLLRGILVGAHPSAIVDHAVADEPFKPEPRRTKHHREATLPEVVAVKGVTVMLPAVRGIPGVGRHVVLTPVRLPEDVVLCEARPPRRRA